MKSFYILILSILFFSGGTVNSQNFTKITTGAIVNDGGWSYSFCWADFNNDGKQDLFVCNNN